MDDVFMHKFTENVPRNAMYVMANTWWPNWLPLGIGENEVPDQLESPKALKIESITY